MQVLFASANSAVTGQLETQKVVLMYMFAAQEEVQVYVEIAPI